MTTLFQGVPLTLLPFTGKRVYDSREFLAHLILITLYIPSAVFAITISQKLINFL